MKIAFRTLPVMALSFALCTPGLMVQSVADAQDSTQQPDNSAQNKRQTKTADDQSNATTDRTITANVRKAIIADKDLSMYAHNVKILTHNGSVTLKGPVKSDEEKHKVASDAATVVSQDKVVNQLTVKQ